MNDATSPMNDIDLGIGPIVILVIYLCGMIGLGILGRVKSEEKSLRDFYLGGSSFGLFVLFLTFFATQYSGNTMLGFAGRSYRAGGSYVVSILFMALAICVLTFYGPRLYKLARTFGYVTPADYIYHRFGSHPPPHRLRTPLLLGTRQLHPRTARRNGPRRSRPVRR